MSALDPSLGKCVICGKPQERDYKPFCSRRCADVDLNRWFSGGYAIPAVEEDDAEKPADQDNGP